MYLHSAKRSVHDPGQSSSALLCYIAALGKLPRCRQLCSCSFAGSSCCSGTETVAWNRCEPGHSMQRRRAPQWQMWMCQSLAATQARPFCPSSRRRGQVTACQRMCWQPLRSAPRTVARRWCRLRLARYVATRRILGGMREPTACWHHLLQLCTISVSAAHYPVVTPPQSMDNPACCHFQR